MAYQIGELCRRCHEGRYRKVDGKCSSCGVARGRRIERQRRRQARIGGKRGHTSGKVGSNKK